MGRQRFKDPYKWLIVALGSVALAFAVYSLPMPRFDLRFMLLTAVMVLVSSRFSVQIPRLNTSVTVSDTFIFLVLLLYGGLAGIMLAGGVGILLGRHLRKGLRTCKKIPTVSLYLAMRLVSATLTCLGDHLIFAPRADFRVHD